MGFPASHDSRVDAYIAKSAEFARPILEYLRDVVHEGCPEVTETIKWSFPCFEYKGILCFMSAFKQHCGFGFWKGALVMGEGGGSGEAMGQFGRITSLKDLPPKKQLLALVRKAVKMHDEGIKAPARATRPKAERTLEVPADLTGALRRNKQAAANFKAFTYSKQKDYVEWLTEAKTTATRERRLATAIEWIAENKGRNWKYEKC